MDGLLDEFDDLELSQPLEAFPDYDTIDDKGKAPCNNTNNNTADDACSSGCGCSASHNRHQDNDATTPCPPSPSKSSEPGELTCAICLHEIPLEDMAMVKGCDHIYCACCILHWSLHKENPWCPQCKRPFSALLTYRGIDGLLNDFPMEESVALLKRATWFEDSLRGSRFGAGSLSLLEQSQLADDTAWQDYADDYDLAEDEAIEDFYFSSAAGRARVTLGNRRFGEGGYISTGRRQARPAPSSSGKKSKGSKAARAKATATASTVVAPPPLPAADGGGGGGASSSGAGGSTSSGSGRSIAPLPVASSVAIPTPNANGGRKAQHRGSSPIMAASPHLSAEWGSYCGSAGSGSGSGILGSSPSGSGRRARRNARRAAEDAAIAGSDSGSLSSPFVDQLPPIAPPPTAEAAS